MPTNYYPELPVVQYFKGTIPQADAIAYIKSIAVDITTQEAVLALVNNESGNLEKVINGVNACGFQSDSGRWNSKWDSVIVATTNLMDSTSAYRGFLVFDKWQSCFDMALYYIVQRGMNAGTSQEMATKYYQNWVYGDSTYTPTAGEISGYVSLLSKAAVLLGMPSIAPVTPIAAPSVTIVRYGDTDTTTNGMVTKIQTKLASLNLMPDTLITGNYYHVTENAIKEFQGDNGLTVDGIAGAKTLGALGL